MEPFPNDNLDPAFLLGDRNVQLRAIDPDTIVYGMRHLMKYTLMKYTDGSKDHAAVLD